MSTNNNKNSDIPQTSKAGIIGFCLGLSGFVTLGLTTIPGLLFSIVGLIRKGHRILAGFGVCISVVCLYLSSTFAPGFLPPGVIPQPLQKIIYSPGSFWEKYDTAGLQETNYYGSSVTGGSSWIYFKSDTPGTYTVDKAIAYAEQYGWVYHGKTKLKTQVFTDNFNNGRLDWEKDIDDSLIHLIVMYLTYFQWEPFEIQRDCTIIAFEALKPHYLIVSADGREMEVRIITRHFPDPPIEIPEQFKKSPNN